MSSLYKLNSLRYRWFLNTSILQIFATLLISYVSFKYSDFYTIKANIAGIGFNDLDDGHIKNIEMYGYQ